MGGKFYTFVRRATDEESKSHKCSLPCIYEKEGRQFCFRPGHLVSECTDGDTTATTASGDTTLSTAGDTTAATTAKETTGAVCEETDG